MSQATVDRFLQQGIAATKGGDKTAARLFFVEAIRLDPDNEYCWLWLALVVSSPDKARYCLERALQINPNNQQAQAALGRLGKPAGDKPSSSGHTGFLNGTPTPTVNQIERPASSNGAYGTGKLAATRPLTTPPRRMPAYQPPAPLAEPPAVETATPEPDAAEPTSVNGSAPSLPRDRRVNGSPLARPARQTILIVDDSITIRKLVAMTLSKSNYRVVEAEDGMDALARVAKSVPDLILLDISMPRMDGYQVCRVLKDNEATRHVPVIMLSGNDGFFDRVKGRMAGASQYITKPFEPAVLLSTVRRRLKSERPQRLSLR